MSRMSLTLLAQGTGFQPDLRFAPDALPMTICAEPADPVALAWNEGYAAGQAEAIEQARLAGERSDAERETISLALVRLDARQQEHLRLRLHATIEALCEAALAPLARDPDAMSARIERAVAMLARADDDKLLRLHPDDLALIGDRLPEGLEVLADPALDRGAVRLETANGGVEDGPAHWRRAIAEAIGQC